MHRTSSGYGTFRRGVLTMVALAALVVGLSACGSSSKKNTSSSASAKGKPAASSSASAGKVSVTIKSFKFMPPTIKVAKGATVTFTNKDSASHTATASNAAQKAKFDTDTLMTGQSKSITFDTPGTYKYLCQFHPFMTGTVIVE
jgi:plastocyanin